MPPAFRDLVLRVRGYYHEGPVQHQVVLVDGVTRGLWEWAKDDPGRIVVRVLTPLTDDERRWLEEAIARMGEFFGVVPLSTSWISICPEEDRRCWDRFCVVSVWCSSRRGWRMRH